MLSIGVYVGETDGPAAGKRGSGKLSKGRGCLLVYLKWEEDEEGTIRSIRNIHLIKTEEKYFAGIKMKRYDCCAEDCGIMKYFTLLYHIEEGRWDMVIQ